MFGQIVDDPVLPDPVDVRHDEGDDRQGAGHPDIGGGGAPEVVGFAGGQADDSVGGHQGHEVERQDEKRRWSR